NESALCRVGHHSSKEVAQSGSGKQTRRSAAGRQNAVEQRAAAPCPAPAWRALEPEFSLSEVPVGNPRIRFPGYLRRPPLAERANGDARGPRTVAPLDRQALFDRRRLGNWRC